MGSQLCGLRTTNRTFRGELSDTISGRPMSMRQRLSQKDVHDFNLYSEASNNNPIDPNQFALGIRAGNVDQNDGTALTSSPAAIRTISRQMLVVLMVTEETLTPGNELHGYGLMLKNSGTMQPAIMVGACGAAHKTPISGVIAALLMTQPRPWRRLHGPLP